MLVHPMVGDAIDYRVSITFLTEILQEAIPSLSHKGSIPIICPFGCKQQATTHISNDRDEH
jgi:hypothetical protein